MPAMCSQLEPSNKEFFISRFLGHNKTTMIYECEHIHWRPNTGGASLLTRTHAISIPLDLNSIAVKDEDCLLGVLAEARVTYIIQLTEH